MVGKWLYFRMTILLCEQEPSSTGKSLTWTGTSMQTCCGTCYWEKPMPVRFPVCTSPQAYSPSSEVHCSSIHYYPSFQSCIMSFTVVNSYLNWKWLLCPPLQRMSTDKPGCRGLAFVLCFLRQHLSLLIPYDPTCIRAWDCQGCLHHCPMIWSHQVLTAWYCLWAFVKHRLCLGAAVTRPTSSLSSWAVTRYSLANSCSLQHGKL